MAAPASTRSFYRRCRIRTQQHWDRAKREIPYARVQRGFHFQHEVDFKIYVSIEYREIISGEPATQVFDEMGKEVAAICGAIEAESRKIGLLK
jgi:hypothetical protein